MDFDVDLVVDLDLDDMPPCNQLESKHLAEQVQPSLSDVHVEVQIHVQAQDANPRVPPQEPVMDCM